MITTADLKSHTKADLAEMAKRLGVSVSGSMRKDDLVVAVARASKAAKTQSPPR
ncbi:MAG: Rho termination factor N-terminal domain-containing protein [Pirellulaceae bacterium]